MSQVNTELGRPTTQASSMNEAALRNLAGAPSGSYGMNNFYGKSNIANVIDYRVTANVSGGATIQVPTGAIAGERLLSIATAYSTGVNPSYSGWTLIQRLDVGGNHTVWVYHKVAVGNDPNTTLNVVSTTTILAFTFRLSGVGNIACAITGAGSGSSIPNPPALSAPWGAKTNLWITSGSNMGVGSSFSSGPAGYPAVIAGNTPGSDSGVMQQGGAAWRYAQVTTEDPGPFTMTGSGNGWHGITIAVEPSVK